MGNKYLRTCREEILTAIDALERRHGRTDFAPVEIIQEARANGSTHAESSLRTHIVSRMCVNAPPNHIHRTDELIRTSQGYYARYSC